MASLTETLFARTRSATFREEVASLLLELCAIDTTPKTEPKALAAAEDAVFQRLEAELARVALPGLMVERRGVSPAVADHPAFTPLHHFAVADGGNGPSPAAAYAGRANLVCAVPGRNSGAGVALNAHIDTVAPHVPPRRSGDTIHGRGSCDDKGSCVAMVAALRLLGELLPRFGLELEQNLVCLFPVEEETGGNGSLSLALDRDLKQRYDCLVVLECAGNDIHPANRGAVWYESVLAHDEWPLVEAASFLIAELEAEGRALRAESRDPLFPERPVQTCHGRLGPWGEHPSRICGEAAFLLKAPRPADAGFRAAVEDVLAAALAAYTGVYGDYTVAANPSGQAKIERHCDVEVVDEGLRVVVHGTTGHMGSIHENDGAITKLATLVRALVRSRAFLEQWGAGVACELVGAEDPAVLRLEGGQGFLPTHRMEAVMARVAAAAERGVARYAALRGGSSAAQVRTRFDKLHNAAFAGAADAPAMRNAVAAARQCGLWRDQPIRGWTVSCDARLFATEYPDLPVLTTGPGQLAHAHSDDEQLALEDLVRTVEWLVLFILRQTGTGGDTETGGTA